MPRRQTPLRKWCMGRGACKNVSCCSCYHCFPVAHCHLSCSNSFLSCFCLSRSLLFSLTPKFSLAPPCRHLTSPSANNSGKGSNSQDDLEDFDWARHGRGTGGGGLGDSLVLTRRRNQWSTDNASSGSGLAGSTAASASSGKKTLASLSDLPSLF